MTTPSTLRPPTVWQLALRNTLRDFRAGELRLVLVAVVLAVTALTAVAFFADRLQASLKRDAAAMLGGDVVIAADNPVPAAFTRQSDTLGLQSSRSASFPSMARAGDEDGGATRLVSVKAVDDHYPLRGLLTLRDSADGPERQQADRPAPGTVFVDPAVADSLGLQVGQWLWLGEARLKITALLVVEPDRGAGFLGFAPRVMLHQADLAATALVQNGSRINHRLALASVRPRDAALESYANWARATIAQQGLRGIRVESLDEGRPEMRQTLDRADMFLNLVALLAALLAAVAVAIAARDFAQRHLDDCAMLRVLGLSQRRIAASYALEFALLGLLASGLGVLAGLALHTVFLGLLGALLPASLPPPGLWPALFGLGVGLTLLLAFGLPPVLQLARVPPLRVIRRDLGGIKPASLGVLLTGTLGFAALLLAVARDLTLGLIAVGGFAAAIALFALLAWLAVKALARWVPETRAPRWAVLAVRQMASRPAFAVSQVSALAVGLMALALLVLLRTDLIDSWRQATPANAPNRFVINIQPEQASDFLAALDRAGVTERDWYPMIRGRLVRINQLPASGHAVQGERGQRLLEREFNLSHGAELPSHNQVAQGRWTANEAGGLSVEQGLAEQLNLKLGDELEFDMAGQLHSGRITSLRKLDWGSMRVNFFVLFPQAQMPELPLSYIAAFRAPEQAGFDNHLAKQFPNITNVDVSASVAQLRGVLDQVIQAVEYLFGFTVAAGLAVLFAAVGASREARAHEYAVMRACGASAELLGRVQRAELLGLGALAGLLATGAASVVGWALARWAFQFNWTGSAWVPLVGAVAGALLALGAGWWSLREVLRRPVMETLRRAGG